MSKPKTDDPSIEQIILEKSVVPEFIDIGMQVPYQKKPHPKKRNGSDAKSVTNKASQLNEIMSIPEGRTDSQQSSKLANPNKLRRSTAQSNHQVISQVIMNIEASNRTDQAQTIVFGKSSDAIIKRKGSPSHRIKRRPNGPVISDMKVVSQRKKSKSKTKKPSLEAPL